MEITSETLFSFFADNLWKIVILIGIGYYIGEYFGVKAYKKKTKYSAEPVPEKGWRCPNCGQPHPYFEKVCSCGVKKEDVEAVKDQTPETEKEDAFAEVVKYKKLLDDGILTQEEFDAKKKQLLD